MSNDQRMVDVGLLEEVMQLDIVWPKKLHSKLRAIISGPGVEPVAYLMTRTYGQYRGAQHFSYSPSAIGHIAAPLYLAAPSTPVQAVPDDAFTDEELDSIQRVLFDNCGPTTAKKVRAMLAATPQPPKENSNGF